MPRNKKKNRPAVTEDARSHPKPSSAEQSRDKKPLPRESPSPSFPSDHRLPHPSPNHPSLPKAPSPKSPARHHSSDSSRDRDPGRHVQDRNPTSSADRSHAAAATPGPSRPSAAALPALMSGMDLNQQRGAAASSSMPLVRPMSRPGFGTVGRAIRLEANFFHMKLPPNLVISQHAVSIYQLRHPDEADPQKRKKCRDRAQLPPDEKEWMDVSAIEPIFYNRNVFRLFIERYKRQVGCRLAYDGRSIAYAPRKVNPECLDDQFALMVDREGNPVADGNVKQDRVEEVRVSIMHAKDLRIADVLNRRVDTRSSVEYLSALDNVLAHSPMARYVQVGRSFYSPEGATPLGRDGSSAVSAWRGFYQSARLSQLGIVVNLDESFTTFWNRGGQPLMSLVRDINRGRDLSGNPQERRVLSSNLKLLKVRAVHTGITYKVHGFSSQGADHISFADKSGRRVSISEYFHENYGMRLRHGNVPCVKTHPKRDTYLPMEVLTVLDNQRMLGLLTPDQTASMVRRASTRPLDKKKAAQTTMRSLQHGSDPLCKDFGISVDSQLVKVNARILPAPTMLYNGNKAASVANGTWRPGGRFFAPAFLKTWAVVVESGCVQNNVCQDFLRQLKSSAQKGGVYMAEPRQYTAGRDRIPEELLKVARDYEKNRSYLVEGIKLQMMVILKDHEDAMSYNAIKRTSDIELGIVTQVLLSKNLRNPRGLNMYCDNVMLKINSKLGGQNCCVSPYGGMGGVPDVPFVRVPHIVLGADVTHPMPGGKTPSVAALVGSRDKEGVQFSGAIRTQKGKQEVIEDLGEMFMEVYEHWMNNFGNKYHVKSVIMFRDGVSEGQFEEVMTREVAALRRACEKCGSGCRPRITYIIVTKRHHARFFAERENTDRSGNTVAGTVVDRDVTSDEFYDFYLNSHAGIQGTSRPSKYTVLIDENNIPVDALQAYVFRLSHGFVRCNRSVSMVNSAYYAHLLAFRGRAYLGEDFSDSMSTASGSSVQTVVPPTPMINAVLKRRLFFV